MARRRTKSTGFGWLVILMLVVCGAAASLAYYIASNSKPASKPVMNHMDTVKPNAPKPLLEERKVIIYLPKVTTNDVTLVPVTRETDVKGDILDVALEALLAADAENAPGNRIIPDGTELLSPVKVRDGLATVDFSREFKDNFSGGSAEESLTLNSIVSTLVSNSSGRVKNVLILVEGKTVETLGGHFGLDEPLSEDSLVPKPGS